MSSKPYERLNAIDRDLRATLPMPGMTNEGVQLTIEKIIGFELFNTRPYHNYETFSDGWRVRGFGITFEAEDLDDAVRGFILAYERKRTPSVAVAKH